MKRSKLQREKAEQWLVALQAGAQANRERLNANLEAGRVWTDARRAGWKEKLGKTWTPEMRQAAAERAAARHAARKAAAQVLENQHHADTNATK